MPRPIHEKNEVASDDVDATCPRCWKRAADEYIASKNSLKEQYGVLPADEYVKKTNELAEKNPMVGFSKTLRQITTTSLTTEAPYILTVEVESKCSECDFEHTHTHVKNISEDMVKLL